MPVGQRARGIQMYNMSQLEGENAMLLNEPACFRKDALAYKEVAHEVENDLNIATAEKSKDQAPIAMLNADTTQTGYCLGAHLSASGKMRKVNCCEEEIVAGSHAEDSIQEITVSTSSHED